MQLISLLRAEILKNGISGVPLLKIDKLRKPTLHESSVNKHCLNHLCLTREIYWEHANLLSISI